MKKENRLVEKVASSDFVAIKKKVDFRIELKNGEEITINKWILENDMESDNGWEVVENQEEYDKMDDDEKDLFYDFVLNLIV